MAMGALAGLLGPQLREYASTYEWEYTWCSMRCTGSATLLVSADGQTFSWDEPSGRCLPAMPANFARDAQRAHWFVGGGGVWVLKAPGDSLKFFASSQDAVESKAPTVTAMRRSDGPSPASATSAQVAGASAVEASSIAKQKPRAYSDDGRKLATNQRQQTQMEAAQKREDAKFQERKAIDEAMEFARMRDMAA
jgi:hypothetical protein